MSTRTGNPWPYVNAITENKKPLIVDDLTEKEYIPYLTNHALSYHYDCVMAANEMNRLRWLTNAPQFYYLINTIRGQRRPYMKWIKHEKPELLSCIKTVYGFSDNKARQALSLLNQEQLAVLQEMVITGGVTNAQA